MTAFAANSYNFSHFTLRWKGRFLTENFFYRCRLKFTNLPTANFFAVFSVNGWPQSCTCTKIRVIFKAASENNLRANARFLSTKKKKKINHFLQDVISYQLTVISYSLIPWAFDIGAPRCPCNILNILMKKISVKLSFL